MLELRWVRLLRLGQTLLRLFVDCQLADLQLAICNCGKVCKVKSGQLVNATTGGSIRNCWKIRIRELRITSLRMETSSTSDLFVSRAIFISP